MVARLERQSHPIITSCTIYRVDVLKTPGLLGAMSKLALCVFPTSDGLYVVWTYFLLSRYEPVRPRWTLARTRNNGLRDSKCGCHSSGRFGQPPCWQKEPQHGWKTCDRHTEAISEKYHGRFSTSWVTHDTTFARHLARPRPVKRLAEPLDSASGARSWASLSRGCRQGGSGASDGRSGSAGSGLRFHRMEESWVGNTSQKLVKIEAIWGDGDAMTPR